MTNIELNIAYNLTNTFPCVGFTTDDIMKILALTGELKEKYETYNSARNKIFESVGIVVTQGQINMEKFPKELNQIRELDNSEVSLDNWKFLAKETFVKAVERGCATVIMTPQDIMILQETLVKE